MEYVVSRSGTALVTLHGGSATTACDDAQSELAETLEALEAAGTLVDWDVPEASVLEHPTAPFDPYTISVSFRVATTVEADGKATAAERGAGVIDDALANAGVESVSYASGPTASAT